MKEKKTTIDEIKMYAELTSLITYCKKFGTFSDAILKYMIEKDLRTRDLYTRAYISRSLYSKIITSPQKYHPSKETCFEFCLAFELPIEEAVDLLALAGFTFAHNSPRENVIRYFIENGIYSLDLLNETLYHYKLPCLGDNSIERDERTLLSKR